LRPEFRGESGEAIALGSNELGHMRLAESAGTCGLQFST
jgi:hypothetical protein